MIHLFTDFGWGGPYVGEMKSVLAREVPDVAVIDLMHDAPAFNPRASAYLLAALSRRFRPGDVCLAVVDPGVGDQNRRPILLDADGVKFVGPDNGLFALVTKQAASCGCREILWRPENLSRSFHGRDLFAPVVAKSLKGVEISTRQVSTSDMVGQDWPQQLAEVIYIDQYGNAITGLPGKAVSPRTVISIAGKQLAHAETFSAADTGCAFWYENSMGLVEFAANSASVSEQYHLAVGMQVVWR